MAGKIIAEISKAPVAVGDDSSSSRSTISINTNESNSNESCSSQIESSAENTSVDLVSETSKYVYILHSEINCECLIIVEQTTETAEDNTSNGSTTYHIIGDNIDQSINPHYMTVE